MLQGITIAVPPAAVIASATGWQPSAFRLDTTTFAPWLASSSAIARPMPRLDPVTMATLPVRSKRFVSGEW
jgi:hypothetical protein